MSIELETGYGGRSVSTSREAVLALMLPVAEQLQKLERKFVFVGGSVVPFYVTDVRVSEFRPTKDVDVIVEAITRNRMDQIEEELRRNGFRNFPEAIHRFTLGAILVDVLPVQSRDSEMLNRWYPVAYATAEPIAFAVGTNILIPTAPCFLATKFEAFVNRGRGDFLESKDLEDILTIIGGREEIVEEVAHSPSDIRSFLSDTIGRMIKMEAFRECIEGNISPTKSMDEALFQLVDRLDHLERISRMAI